MTDPVVGAVYVVKVARKKAGPPKKKVAKVVGINPIRIRLRMGTYRNGQTPMWSHTPREIDATSLVRPASPTEIVWT